MITATLMIAAATLLALTLTAGLVGLAWFALTLWRCRNIGDD